MSNSTLSAAGTLTARGLLKLRRHPQRLFDVVVLPVVGTAMVAGVFGPAISGSTTQAYLPTLIPGIMVMLCITSAVMSGVQLCEDIDTGVFDRFRSLPISRLAPLIGALTADTVRYLIAVVMTVSTGLLMGWRPASLPGLVLGMLLPILIAFAMSWLFALVGVLIDEPTAVQSICMISLMPFAFLSNVLVPADKMVWWLSAFSSINPISHMTTAVRQLINEGTIGMEFVWALAGAGAILAIFVPLTVRAYVRKN